MQVFLSVALLATTAALHSTGSALLRRGQTTSLPTRRLRCDRQRSVVFHGGSHSHAHHDHEHESGGGLSPGAITRAIAVGAAIWFVPLPMPLPGCFSAAGGCGSESVAQALLRSPDSLRATVATCVATLLLASEASRGLLVETRSKIGSLYTSYLKHQASARMSGMGASDGRGDSSGNGSTISANEVANARAANRVTVIGAVVNVGLVGVKLIAGLAAGSAALVADAGHSLSDLLSDFVTLATLRVSRLPPDADHPYGHGRFEALGALLIASLLCTTALAFGNHAYEGLLEAVAQTAAQATAAAESASAAAAAAAAAPSSAMAAAPGAGAAAGAVATAAAAELATSGSGSGVAAAGWWRLGKEQLKGHLLAAGAALVSILSKELLFVTTKRVGERTNSPVLVANAWHHRSDALSSVVALLGVLGAAAGLPLLDPLAGLAVAGMVATTGIHVAWDALRELTDTVDDNAVAEAGRVASSTEGVIGVGQVRARRTGATTLVDLRVDISPHLPASAAAQVAEATRWRILQALPTVSEVLVRTHPDPVLPPGGGPELAFSVRGADAIEADVRAAIRTRLMTSSSSSPPAAPAAPAPVGASSDAGAASVATADTTVAPAALSDATLSGAAADATRSEALSSSSGQDHRRGGGAVRVSTVHRVTVHYAGLDPIVEVLLGVGHHPYHTTATNTGAAGKHGQDEGQGRGGVDHSSSSGGGAKGSTTLEELEALGEAAKAAAESVPDVARAQVHLRLGGGSSLHPTIADRALSLGTESSLVNQDQGTSLLSQWPAVSTPPKKEFV